MAEAPGWTLGAMDFSGKVLGSWDTYHHPDKDQILITTLYNSGELSTLVKKSRRVSNTNRDAKPKIFLSSHLGMDLRGG